MKILQKKRKPGDAAGCAVGVARGTDPRNIRNGRPLPGENYVDQPYIVVTPGGAWVCTLTTGIGQEGQEGQHVAATTSYDQGQNWSPLRDIEPACGPSASWVTPLVTPHGRIYAFYVYNDDNINTLPGSTTPIRADTHGWYVFRYSDDDGATWSPRRYRVPLRQTAVDRHNPWRGEVCHFWSIDKPKVQNGCVYWALTKLGAYFMREGEGWVIESPNILTEDDPAKVVFKLLPQGDHGIRNPALGSIQEEHNLVPLAGNDMLCVFRLETGAVAQSYSRDGGATWSLPQALRYGPGQRVCKTPRANAKLFKTAAGRYLLWYHHNGLRSWTGRNPAFLAGGILHDDGFVHWSEPEIVLFDEDPAIGMSYPDLIEQAGRFWIAATQKKVARVHELDPTMLSGLWRQDEAHEICEDGLALEVLAGQCGGDAAEVRVPEEFGDLRSGGATIELLLQLTDDAPGEILFSTLHEAGAGVQIKTATLDGHLTLAITLTDGIETCRWHTDPGAVVVGRKCHVVIICDVAATVLAIIANGEFLDGGTHRPYEWGRIPAALGTLQGARSIRLGAEATMVRVYGRALRTGEAIGNFRATML